MADNSPDFTNVRPLDGVTMLPDSDRIRLEIVHGMTFAQLFAKSNEHNSVCERLGIGGQPGRATALEEFTALPLSPGQWMLMSRISENGVFARRIADQVAGIGYVSDQSDSRVCLRLSGTQARTVMAKGCRLDLHPKVAGIGFCAQTVMAQVGVLLHQTSDVPSYDLMLYAGFARSFWDWLCEAAAEFAY